jgi:Ca-activated chloride channel family protein
MTFLAPGALVLLVLLVPVLVAGYVWIVRRRAATESEFGTMARVHTRSGKPLGWRRHVLPAVFLLGVVVLLVGLARPEATVDLPRREGTVILAFDVSSSMKAKDLAPTRMAAAKRAARGFIADQPSSIRIGVVAFSDAGYVVQRPTRSHDDVLAAVGRLSPRGATALGRGILASLEAVTGEPIALDGTALEHGARQPDVHFLGSAAVILLSDGDNTAALDPLALAPVAAQAGVRIFPIGLGSPDGAVVEIDGFQVATALDANLLRGVARRSGGTYFNANDASALRRVYDTIDLRLTVAGRKTEITAIFAGAGLLLFLVAAGFSMRWYGRVI